ncbi:MAG TPA: UDP-N-acetylmuramate dehydrogenase [Patescibacteria group bacterium]|jgi:UDP-N-acetylmuramate dehydrogenase|nr:UDP-N-acetylmuramate dehydrogenase [Patescibacteria group bacterium]
MIIPSSIQQYIPLADKNWFASGGLARFFALPKTAADFQEAIQFAKDFDISLFLLGKGANILIADEGFDGLIIQPQLTEITVVQENSTHIWIKAGAGVSLDILITWCLNHQIVGLEEFSGIPGTVGGAVYINLHYFEFLLQQFLSAAEIIDAKTSIIQSVDNEWFAFDYDYSKLHERNHYLATATFQLTKASIEQTAFAKGRSIEIIRHRARRYPQKNTCGSFFRNFHDHEVHLTIDGKKIIYAAYYLDKLGVKGTLKYGGAQVSSQHANMIINTGNATSNDIVTLARIMQEMVLNEFGIIPQPECQLLGFDMNILL